MEHVSKDTKSEGVHYEEKPVRETHPRQRKKRVEAPAVCANLVCPKKEASNPGGRSASEEMQA